ncbi:hypothetical protein QOT17_018062 [Balamuthia mandrillaris]
MEAQFVDSQPRYTVLSQGAPQYVMTVKMSTELLEHLTHLQEKGFPEATIVFGEAENKICSEGKVFPFSCSNEVKPHECYRQEGSNFIKVGPVKKKIIFAQQLRTQDRDRIKSSTLLHEEKRKANKTQQLSTATAGQKRKRVTSTTLATTKSKRSRPQTLSFASGERKTTTPQPLSSASSLSRPKTSAQSSSFEQLNGLSKTEAAATTTTITTTTQPAQPVDVTPLSSTRRTEEAASSSNLEVESKKKDGDSATTEGKKQEQKVAQADEKSEDDEELLRRWRQYKDKKACFDEKYPRYQVLRAKLAENRKEFQRLGKLWEETQDLHKKKQISQQIESLYHKRHKVVQQQRAEYKALVQELKQIKNFVNDIFLQNRTISPLSASSSS